MKVRVGDYQWSRQYLFYAAHTEGNNQITLVDSLGRETLIKVKSVDSFYGTKEIIFYVDGYIINETDLPLVYNYHSRKKKNKETEPLAGQ